MKKLLIVSSVIVVTLVTLAVVGYAFAQTTNPPNPEQGAGTQTTPWMMGANRQAMARRAGMMGWRQGYRQGMMNGFVRGFSQGAFGPLHDYMITSLAAKLGISADDLNSRIANDERPYEIALSLGFTDAEALDLLQQAHSEALQAAVADGVISQKVADRMSQMMGKMGQAGGLRGRMGGMRGRAASQSGPLHDYKIAAFAQALGLSQEQVEARLQAGENMWQIAESQGLSLEQFQTKMLEAVKNAVGQALANGTISQAQADSMLQRAAGMGVRGFGPGGCPGMGGNAAPQP